MTTAMPRAPRMRHAAMLVGLAVLASLAVPIIVGGGDALVQTLNFSWHGYLVLFSVIAASWLARALKLRLLLRRVGLRLRPERVLAMSLAIDFAFISTPAGLGGYAAGIYYLRRAGASGGAAATVIAADQILDLAFFALALPLAGMSLLWSDLPPALAGVAFSTGIGMFAGGFAAWLARGRLARWLLGDNALVRRWPALRRRQHLLHEFFAAVGTNVRLLFSGGTPAALAIVGFTAVQWLTRYGVLWVALALLGEHVSYALTLLLQSLILHAAMWTGVPAGGGTAELGLTAALTPWVPATAMATALLLWRIVTFHLCLLAGLIAVVLLVKRRHPVPGAHEPPREAAH